MWYTSFHKIMFFFFFLIESVFYHWQFFPYFGPETCLLGIYNRITIVCQFFPFVSQKVTDLGTQRNKGFFFQGIHCMISTLCMFPICDTQVLKFNIYYFYYFFKDIFEETLNFFPILKICSSE